MADYNQDIQFMSPRIDYFNSSVAPISDIESEFEMEFIEKEFAPIKIGPKIFQCPWLNCQKTLKAPGHVIIHVRSHTGEKPFVCPEANCHQKFVSQILANQHCQWTHSEKLTKKA